MRKFNGNKPQLSVSPGHLKDLLAGLESCCPGIQAQLFDQDGNIKRYINVFINGEDIRSLEGEKTVVNERDTVHIIPAMAGG
jgi:molybdopterin synthase sulfur carrier subunit